MEKTSSIDEDEELEKLLLGCISIFNYAFCSLLFTFSLSKEFDRIKFGTDEERGGCALTSSKRYSRGLTLLIIFGTDADYSSAYFCLFNKL